MKSKRTVVNQASFKKGRLRMRNDPVRYQTKPQGIRFRDKLKDNIDKSDGAEKLDRVRTWTFGNKRDYAKV